MRLKVTEPVTFGVDLGGTKLETALVDANGQILSVQKEPTQAAKGPEKVIDNIVASMERCHSETSVGNAIALGVGIAGQIDFQGVVLHSPNLRWRNVPLKKKLEERLETPVVVINDVKAAVWGEWRFGSGRNVDDLVALFVGTGIGGGVISGGEMIVGCSNTAGELGHITIVSEGRKCHCPNLGCLEAYAGGWAIAERAQAAVRDDPTAGKRLISLAGYIEHITAATISQAYREGDQLAQQLVNETATFLASGVVGIVNAFNPCLLVLGGGVIEGISDLVFKVEKIARTRALESAVENLRIVKAALGGNAGVVGAAALALNEIGGLP